VNCFFTALEYATRGDDVQITILQEWFRGATRCAAARHHQLRSAESSQAIDQDCAAQPFSDKPDDKRTNIALNDRLYPGTVNDLSRIIHRLGNKMNCVVLVDHDPALSKLPHRLSPVIIHMPTCAIAEFKNSNSTPRRGRTCAKRRWQL
jgi:hypothetical protein